MEKPTSSFFKQNSSKRNESTINFIIKDLDERLNIWFRFNPNIHKYQMLLKNFLFYMYL